MISNNNVLLYESIAKHPVSHLNVWLVIIIISNNNVLLCECIAIKTPCKSFECMISNNNVLLYESIAKHPVSHLNVWLVVIIYYYMNALLLKHPVRMQTH